MPSSRAKRIKQLEEQLCPRRNEAPQSYHTFPPPDWWERGRWAATQEEADEEIAEFMAANPTGSIGNVFWNYGGEQPRTCSYCGGVHPDDALALVKAGWVLDPTGKGSKHYLEPPHPQRGPVPPVKLYTQHFSEEQARVFNQAYFEAQRRDNA